MWWSTEYPPLWIISLMTWMLCRPDIYDWMRILTKQLNWGEIMIMILVTIIKSLRRWLLEIPFKKAFSPGPSMITSMSNLQNPEHFPLAAPRCIWCLDKVRLPREIGHDVATMIQRWSAEKRISSNEKRSIFLCTSDSFIRLMMRVMVASWKKVHRRRINV